MTLPRGIQGSHYFLVRTDATGSVDEGSGESDNVTAGDGTVVQLTPPPDLQVTSVDAPPNAFSGQTMNLGWTVSNLGEGRVV